MKLNLFEKLFVGAYVVKLFGKYGTFPKTAISAILSWLFYCVQYVCNMDFTCIILYSIIPSLIFLIITIISFLYFNIFKNKRPKTKEEIESYVTYLCKK